ncbi:phenylacetic acid degradation protein PaaY [Janthinobacterium sp. ROICE36]|uniref:phenylacetic acid degradation protein PaaY n=1 Tax=Janthinobacterium sp. ROICE36 TaxID=2048670 RepID=UPI000C7F0EA7|nr:phenylacetic acid degradation protein PaaY [Janthinobacterium sp. ROICE36]PLY48494.1 phenylacetic acid degradation protein PaaY [Janthinobacterium sp. ROICE36]
MVKVYEINGLTPVVHPSAYVHPSAVLIGDVIVGPRCYIGPLASIRGDFGRLILEEGANLQDTCVMHGFPGCDTVVETDGHIGHGAVLHGCRIGRNALVGMNAVVMDNAIIGEESIVAAMSFVKAGMIVAPRSMVVGTPAKVIRLLTDDEIKWKSSGTSQYHELAVRSMQTMREVDALTEVEANRQRLNFESALPLHLHKNAAAQ